MLFRSAVDGWGWSVDRKKTRLDKSDGFGGELVKLDIRLVKLEWV